MGPGPLYLRDELTAALSIEDEDSRMQALLDLAPRLPQQTLSEVLEAVPLIQDEATRALAIAGIAPYLDEGQVQAALGHAQFITSQAARCHAWGALGGRLPEKTREKFIRGIVFDTPDPADRLKAWVQLAPYLPSDLKQEAISTAMTLGYEGERSDALIALAPHLPDVWKMKALNSARSIAAPFLRVQTIAGLIPALPKKERANALNEALSLARELESPYDKALGLLTLLPHVPPSLERDFFNEAFEAAESIQQDQQRVEMMTRVLQTRPEVSLGHLKNLLLGDVSSITDEKARAEALITFARLSPPELHGEILEIAQKLEDRKVKSNVIIQLQGIIEQQPASSQPPDAAPAPQVINPEPIQDFPDSDAEPELEWLGADAGAFVDFSDTESESTPSQEPSPEETPPAKPKPRKARVPRKKPAPAVESPVIQGSEPPAPDESVGVKAYLHSDKWTLDDQLNYSLYADAIAEFIFHPDNRPPLAIGVLAPWGQGKTTLMKMIQNQIESKAKGSQAANPAGVVAPPITPGLHFQDLRRWLQDPTNYRLGAEKLNYPTVWFNAWKYQNSEQLWAGMAYFDSFSTGRSAAQSA
ncbi:MAG: hypothetical protein H7Z16_07285 [Pyrinomonadaceae bacterium]|nr:hypothetical protein [Pyrinomonadaceae bacterium]